jgi:hypothetical protein
MEVMPRQARSDASGTLHRVMIREIDGKRIFGNDQDRQDFVAALRTVSKETSTRVLAAQPCPFVAFQRSFRPSLIYAAVINRICARV